MRAPKRRKRSAKDRYPEDALLDRKAEEKRRNRITLLDEKWALIEYHARIIANWRTSAGSAPFSMLRLQGERLLELINSSDPAPSHGGHDHRDHKLAGEDGLS